MTYSGGETPATTFSEYFRFQGNLTSLRLLKDHRAALRLHAGGLACFAQKGGYFVGKGDAYRSALRIKFIGARMGERSTSNCDPSSSMITL